VEKQTFTKEQGYNPQDLIHYALDHFNVAENLFKTNPSYYDSAGYLVHMGFELLLKAWHLEGFGKFLGIHSLSKLVNQIKEIQIKIKKEKAIIAFMTILGMLGLMFLTIYFTKRRRNHEQRGFGQ
jgi:hypothetical protein